MPLNVDTLNAGTISQNGTPIKPYKVYSALLTQNGTDAPVATILENTLGVNITYEYTNTGTYKILASENIFDGNKFCVTQGAGNYSSLVSLWVYNYNQPLNELTLEAYDLGNVNAPGGLQVKNDILVNQYIEIRVYN